MVEQKVQRGSILYDSQDIVVVGSLVEDKYTFAAKPSLEFQKRIYYESVSSGEDPHIPISIPPAEFAESIEDQYTWLFSDREGIIGSSPILALRFDKRALRSKGLWLPGLLESKVLESEGKFEKEIVRDFGLVVYDENAPNHRMAKSLVLQANGLGLELPLVVPFRALDYHPNGNEHKSYGIDVSFVESPKGIIDGDKAIIQIDSLVSKGESGVSRLFKGFEGGICAWNGCLDDSLIMGRVDWICGETYGATLKELGVL